jgi:hypothetical protein
VPDMHTTAPRSASTPAASATPTDAAGSGERVRVPLLLLRHFRGGTDHNRVQLILCPDSGHGSLFQYRDLFLSHARLFLDGLGL